ncbi:MAG: alpha/beta hydrolase [Thermoanaerobaculia bacterium]
MRRAPILAVLTWLCIPGLIRGGEAAAPAPKLELKPCTTPGLPPEARCGTYEVWENRAAKSGRKIPLRVVVLPALGPDRLPDPFVHFTGGPGNSSVMAGVTRIAQELAAVRQRRDFLLVDFRGTGGSAGLFCPELQGNEVRNRLMEDYMPPEQVKACAERLGKTADLTQYTNDASVDDVDEVRAALGYDKVNLMGISGGSRSVLIYLRRHPDRVRTAVLWGVWPPDERGAFGMARNTQQALDGLIAECASDPACNAAFPKLRDDVAAVLRQAEKEPVKVAMTDGDTGKPVEVRLTRTGLAQTLRYMLYAPSSAALLPLEVHLAAQGNWKPLVETARFYAGNLNSAAMGYTLALTCSEDIAFIREEEIPAAVQGSFLGDFRIRAQQAACAQWPAPRLGREFLDPVTSDVPVLLVSGELDPATPPANAERAARTLKNHLRVVVPAGGHDFEGIEGADCLYGLIARFVETGTEKGLDTSCLKRMKRPEFALKRDADVELPADQLARLAGTYKDRESGYEMRIETLGPHLRSVADGQRPFMLVATSPTRFRIAGLPGYFFDFQITEGRATACTLVEPGVPPFTLTREGD